MKKKSFFILVMVLFLFILCFIPVGAICPHGVMICDVPHDCGNNTDGICPEDYGANCCDSDCPTSTPDIDCGQDCCIDDDCADPDTYFCNTTTHICELIPVTDDKDFSQTACINAGFNATGIFCCSEVDDTNTWVKESYNEPGEDVGACFKSVFQENNQYLNYSNRIYNNVFVFNGTFYGCDFDDSLFSPETQGLCQPDANGWLNKTCLQRIEDWPDPGTGGDNTRTGMPVIKEADYCTIINPAPEQLYCSFDDAWGDTLGNDYSHKSLLPGPLLDYFKTLLNNLNLKDGHCCSPNTCWDPSFNDGGGACIGTSNTTQINGTTGYVCLNGNWTEVPIQKSHDGCDFGSCPEPGQCLYAFNGLPSQNGNVSEGANPRCINHGQYIHDYLCDNSTWTTRTKMLALKLSSIINDNDDFVLMCSPAEEVLVSQTHQSTKRQQNTDAANNFCVLNWDGRRILGTTLNRPLYDLDLHIDFISALEDSFLSSYPNSGIVFNASLNPNCNDFEQLCINNQYVKLYYDDNYTMVVFSNEDFSLSQTLGQVLCDNLPDWLKWLCPAPPVIEQTLGGLQLFNKVYAARRIGINTKEVFGVAEQVCEPATDDMDWIYSFNYTGFSSVDLIHLVHNIDAEVANITPTQNHVFIKNPDTRKDAWTALTLLRNPEQE